MAVASSPSFTLVSSRRARRGGGSSNAQYEDEEDEMQGNELGFGIADELEEYPDYSRESDAQEQKQQPRSEPEPKQDQRAVKHALVKTIAQQLAVLAWFLDQLPLTSLLLHVGQVESDYITALLDELQDPNIVQRIQRKRQSSASTAVVLSRLLVSAAAPYSSSSSSIPMAQSQSSQPAIETRAIQQALELAVWLLFDKPLGKQMNQFLDRSSRSMLDKATLHKSYSAWLQWLRTQMDNVLVGQSCSTENLINAINSHYAADSELSQQSAERVDRAAWHAFVAHLREVYLSTVPLNREARLAQHRLQPLPLPTSSSSTVLSGYTGTWFCGLEDVRLHNYSGRCSSNASASVLLWFWRQLSCISLTFTNQESAAVLLLSSVFNRSLSENQLTRLVLDNQQRWFRCLPCGASTIALPLIDQRFGDYTARFSSENCLLVQTYSWPSASGVYAYCWRWQIAQTDRSDLRVFLKVERGHFKSSEPENSADESEHLALKLQRIEQWEPAYELQLAYSRLY